jgi:hypothetical protein
MFWCQDGHESQPVTWYCQEEERVSPITSYYSVDPYLAAYLLHSQILPTLRARHRPLLGSPEHPSRNQKPVGAATTPLHNVETC